MDSLEGFIFAPCWVEERSGQEELVSNNMRQVSGKKDVALGVRPGTEKRKGRLRETKTLLRVEREGMCPC